MIHLTADVTDMRRMSVVYYSLKERKAFQAYGVVLRVKSCRDLLTIAPSPTMLCSVLISQFLCFIAQSVNTVFQN